MGLSMKNLAKWTSFNRRNVIKLLIGAPSEFISRRFRGS